MRDIKFRAYDTELKFMVDPSTYFVEFDGSVWFNNTDGIDSDYLCDQSNKLELMQYTGLKDKNGVEIYESDVIRWGDDVIEVVTYDNESACFHAESSMLDSCMEVIGNLHQNPELLK